MKFKQGDYIIHHSYLGQKYIYYVEEVYTRDKDYTDHYIMSMYNHIIHKFLINQIDEDFELVTGMFSY